MQKVMCKSLQPITEHLISLSYLYLILTYFLFLSSWGKFIKIWNFFNLFSIDEVTRWEEIHVMHFAIYLISYFSDLKYHLAFPVDMTLKMKLVFPMQDA